MKIVRVETKNNEEVRFYNVLDGDHIVACGDLDFCVAVMQGRVREYEEKKWWESFKPVEETLWVNIRRLNNAHTST